MKQNGRLLDPSATCQAALPHCDPVERPWPKLRENSRRCLPCPESFCHWKEVQSRRSRQCRHLIHLSPLDQQLRVDVLSKTTPPLCFYHPHLAATLPVLGHIARRPPRVLDLLSIPDLDCPPSASLRSPPHQLSKKIARDKVKQTTTKNDNQEEVSCKRHLPVCSPSKALPRFLVQSPAILRPLLPVDCLQIPSRLISGRQAFA